jgi:hypothetical protein
VVEGRSDSLTGEFMGDGGMPYPLDGPAWRDRWGESTFRSLGTAGAMNSASM